MKTILMAGVLMAVALTAFATILDNFHNVPLGTFLNERDGFKSRGMGPRTFSLYNDVDGRNDLVAGAFDAAHVNDVLHPDMDEEGLGQVERDLAKQNMSPREVSVTVHGYDGVAGFSAIFTRNPSATASSYAVNDTKFGPLYQKWVVQNGYRVLDHVQWPELGENRHAVTFVKDSKPFVFYAGLDEATFAQKEKELAAQGWEIDTFHVALSVANTWLYSGVWLMKADSAYQYFYDMSADEYQQHWTELNAQGYRLKKVFGYGPKGGLFGAIWVK